MPQKLYLIDASGYIFRAYYAIRPLSTSKGLPTNALYGFTSMLLKLIREEKPDHIACVFDVARKTFRNEKFPAYKANRNEPPPDLIPQFPYFRKIARALNLSVLELPNFEADDVIGTIAKGMKNKKLQTVIVTGDKDMMQLVDDQISIFDSMKEKRIGIAQVQERFGVLPEKVPDVLALAGDASDNIPGVPGIGEKTAIKLLQEYGSLENLLKNTSKISGKLGEKLKQHEKEARLFQEIATIVTNAPIEYDFKDFELREPDKNGMRELFTELEFKGLFKELGVEPAGSPKPTEPEKEQEIEIRIGNYLLDPDHRTVPVEDLDELRRRLEEEDLAKLFLEMELPLAQVLATMEKNGVLIDVARLKKSSAEYEIKLRGIEQKVHQLAGGVFNLNSTKQLQEILFTKLQLPVIRKIKTGYSTDVEVLTELAKLHEVPRLLLEYRTLSKLKSTYLDALPELIHPETGRIHTSFNQTVAATGRLSSSNPNLQNIPIRTEEGRKIREAFVAAPGFLLVSADYSQIELRVLAHMSQDPILLEAFRKDEDIHRATAAGIYKIPESEVTEAMRAVGKTVNFAVLYGQGAYSLSQQLEIDPKEAQGYIDNYFTRYGGVSAYKEKVLAEARQQKKVRTLFRRLRHCTEIDSRNQNLRAFTERTAFNTVFQGTAADIIKRAMIAIQKTLEIDFPKAKMILQVHDELVFEVPEGEVEALSRMVKEKMESAAVLAVPLKVDLGQGPNWSEAH